MEKDYLLGQTEESIKVIMSRTKSKDTEYLHSKMEEFIRDSG
jgi:hypothetical protein